jgi:hypothetical protein
VSAKSSFIIAPVSIALDLFFIILAFDRSAPLNHFRERKHGAAGGYATAVNGLRFLKSSWSHEMTKNDEDGGMREEEGDIPDLPPRAFSSLLPFWLQMTFALIEGHTPGF